MKHVSKLILLLFFPGVSFAGLRWESRELEFSPAATASSVKAEFQFTNTGSTAVTIDSVQANCECTTASLEKKTYEPGEKGRVIAIFTIGQRQGLQTKTIRVTTHGEWRPEILTLVAHLPETIKLTPPFVAWEVGSQPVPKTIQIAVAPEAQVHLESVTSSSPKISAVLKAVKEGALYELVVTPSETSSMVMASVSVEGRFGDGSLKKAQAYVQIARPGL